MELTPSERKSTSDVTRARSASRDLVPAVLVLVASQASLLIADPDARSSTWHLLWALTPLAGIALLAWAQLRAFQRADEWERLQQLRAMAVGFGVLVVLLAGVGVLQSAELGDVRQQVQVTLGAGILSWVAALEIPKRRLA